MFFIGKAVVAPRPHQLASPATPLADRHACILRTIPVDHTIFQFSGTRRLAPWAANKHVYQLRELVQTCLPQESAESRYARTTSLSLGRQGFIERRLITSNSRSFNPTRPDDPNLR